MGINLISGCHIHKVKVFHYRGQESKTMMPFYYKHRDCLPNIETLEDQEQEKPWMEEYETDEEIQKLAHSELTKTRTTRVSNKDTLNMSKPKLLVKRKER